MWQGKRREKRQMCRYEDVSLRKFSFEDIPLKIKWINNPLNNEYLHYDLPLEYEKTCRWFERIKNSADRFDAVIECEGKPVGLVGLLNIDGQELSAEYYIAMGDPAYKGKGVAKKASKLILEYACDRLKLKRIYLTVEPANIAAIRLYEKLSFKSIGKKDGQCLYEYCNSEIT